LAPEARLPDLLSERTTDLNPMRCKSLRRRSRTPVHEMMKGYPAPPRPCSAASRPPAHGRPHPKSLAPLVQGEACMTRIASPVTTRRTRASSAEPSRADANAVPAHAPPASLERRLESTPPHDRARRLSELPGASAISGGSPVVLQPTRSPIHLPSIATRKWIVASPPRPSWMSD
jgi:hypothetical protein